MSQMVGAAAKAVVTGRAGDAVRAQDRLDLPRDPGVAHRRRVQALVGVLVRPLPGERVHDDRVRVGRPGRRDDRGVGPVEPARDRAGRAGEDGDYPDRGVRGLRPDLADGPQDLLPLDARRHPAVVVAGLDDHQRRGQAGQPLIRQQPRHRALAVGPGPHVARPGNPVDDGVPAQRPGQVGRPGKPGPARSDPGRVRRADDGHRRDVTGPALYPLLAGGEPIADREHSDPVGPGPAARISGRPDRRGLSGRRLPARSKAGLRGGPVRAGGDRHRRGGNAAAERAHSQPSKPGKSPLSHTSVSVSIPIRATSSGYPPAPFRPRSASRQMPFCSGLHCVGEGGQPGRVEPPALPVQRHVDHVR